nr:immunoglobulin light chain junction region [Macaca mulatta]MOW27308.1 immunoglobulin light chain junction region [Macaca mulatta]MOW27329.1 immunoglobulin light chain junction region [Macaca mulatta]MOW27349.1 immunoglobulin light chain junction region [Macaca mulatta]MOW27563.1 immunoglobulin light chain junction region [Macaca mulatta]
DYYCLLYYSGVQVF